MAVSIHCLGADPTHVARVLSAGTRRVSSTRLPGSLDLALRCVRDHTPDLVVVGGSGANAPALVAALADDAATEDMPVVAWGLAGTSAEAMLLALGARVVPGTDEALLRACEDALDMRDGRTVRVDSPGDDKAAMLHGRRAIVADDDAAVAWFFADALRAAGCDVDEALDGRSALIRARGVGADLVLCDIRMPELDGLRLCRALRADPILGDVGVVLLSWKRDWLQRAQEAGAGASSYLAKHAPPEEVVERAREALDPHLRIEQRFREEGAVRGLLDGISTYRLMRIACATRPESRVTLQCGPDAYEVLVRGGAPRAATRVSAEGGMVRGSAVLDSLLSERAGRFVVTTDRTPIENELVGTLQQQIAPYVARVRTSHERRDMTAPLPPVVLTHRPQAAPSMAPPGPTLDASVPLPLVVRAPPTPAKARRPARARGRWAAIVRQAAAILVAALAVALGSDVRPVPTPVDTVALQAIPDAPNPNESAAPEAPPPGARAFHGPLAHRR